MINVFEPYIFARDKFEVLKSLNKKEISGTSKAVQDLEDQLSIFFNRKYSLAVSNGSTALDVALNALKLKEGDEVILPSFTIISCLSAVIRSGAVPVFCDVDKNTWNMKLKNIEEVFTKKTRAVLMVHTYGLTAEAIEIKQFCKDNSLFLIEDAAEAHGQTYDGIKCGSFGDISTLSFYANKHISSGEGGAVMTDSDEFNSLIKKMRNLDFDNNKRFFHSNLYWNYRISGLQASLAKSQIKSVEKIIKYKKEQGKIYNKLFIDHEELFNLPIERTENSSNHYWVYGLVLKKDGIRDLLMKSLLEDGIETRPFFWPLHLQNIDQLPKKINRKLKNSEFIGNNGLYIPTGAHVNQKIQTFIAETLINKVRSYI